jgi:hypothetical protein
VRSKGGPELRPAGTTQRLNLERKLYGPASQRQVLGFQTFEQTSVGAPFAIDWPVGSAGPKFENGCGLFSVR